MSIIPKHKIDFEACDKLALASDEEVTEVISELLVFLQDMNWPVAEKVLERVKTLKGPLVAPINEIFNGDDDCWKYFVITCLLPNVSIEVVNGVSNELKRIVSKPTENEIKGDVYDEAKIFLTQI